MDWKNLFERAAWTFAEAFFVALPSTITMEIPGAGWVSALLAAACAGLSALKTLIIEVVSIRRQQLENAANDMHVECSGDERTAVNDGADLISKE